MLQREMDGCQAGFCRIQEKSNGERNSQYLFLSRIWLTQFAQQKHFNENFDHTNRGPCLSKKFPKGFDRCIAFLIHIDSLNTLLKTFNTKSWNSVKARIINDHALSP